MMGTPPPADEQSLFSYRIHLEHRVRPDHPLRRLQASLDLSFVAPAVRHTYGRSGNVSVEPARILKMMLLLFYYDIPSERELMEQLPVRLDFLWFLGYDLDSPIPHHSVLSKARARWGTPVFQALFVRTVEQCVQAGLVDGRLLHLDATIVKAHASRNSVRPTAPELVTALREAYAAQERKLEGVTVLPPATPDVAIPPAPPESQAAAAAAATPAAVVSPVAPPQPLSVRVLPSPARVPLSMPPAKDLRPVNETHISLTDPAAQLARNKSQVSEPSYKDHRAVDDGWGVITAVLATSSIVADGSRLPALVAAHQANTGRPAANLTLAGDKHYGTVSNFLYCADQGWRAHLGEASANLAERGKLAADQFTYEPAADRYRCPTGHYLELHQRRPQGKAYLITDPTHCAACALRAQCTKAKEGRSLERHVRALVIDASRRATHTPAALYSRKRRRHVMEGSFADAANNHGLKRARWRGLARQKIQSWLICAVQNLRILIGHGQRRANPAAGCLTQPDFAKKAARSPNRVRTVRPFHRNSDAPDL